jgi:hypothetical protein
MRTGSEGGVDADDAADPGDAADTDPAVPRAGILEEALLESMGSGYEGRLQAAALRTLMRESRAGGMLRAGDRAALARAGHASEAALAAWIRSDSGTRPTDDERAAVEQVVCTRLALANPAYLPRTGL